MVCILFQPTVDIGAKPTDDLKWWWVMVIKRKVLNNSMKFGLVIRAF